MTAYVIKYLDSTGRQASLNVDSDSEQEAIAGSNIPEGQILSVKLNQLAFLNGEIGGAKKIPVGDQAVILQNWASAFGIGAVPEKAFAQSVPDSYKKRIKDSELASCQTTSDYLRALNFPANIVTLIQAGEESNSLTNALEEASEYLLKEAELKQAVFDQIKKGAINTVVGFGALLFGVPKIGGMLADLNKGGTKLNTNAASDVLLKANELMAYSHFIYPAILMLIIGVVYLFKQKPYLPFFSVFFELSKVQRTIFFCNMYRLLIPQGFTPNKLIEFFIQSADGYEKEMYKKMHAELEHGKGLSETMTQRDWLESFKPVVINLEETADNSRLNAILKSQSRTLSLELKSKYAKLASSVSLFGMILLLVSVLIIAAGFYLPFFGSIGGNIGN